MGKLRYKEVDVPDFDGTVEVRDDEPTLNESEACLEAFAGVDESNPASMLRAVRKLALGIVRGISDQEIGELKLSQAGAIYAAALKWFKGQMPSIQASVGMLGEAIGVNIDEPEGD